MRSAKKSALAARCAHIVGEKYRIDQGSGSGRWSRPGSLFDFIRPNMFLVLDLLLVALDSLSVDERPRSACFFLGSLGVSSLYFAL